MWTICNSLRFLNIIKQQSKWKGLYLKFSSFVAKVPYNSSNYKNTFLSSFQNHHWLHRKKMNLSSVIKTLETIAPKHLAEKWDNTGLLIEPKDDTPISVVFLTNDLTKDVLEEATALNADLIISYHPPLFAPIKSLRFSNWKDFIFMKCITNGIAVYSPHTACDAVAGGVNDWLIKCFDLTDVVPITLNEGEQYHVFDCFVKNDFNLEQIFAAHMDTKDFQIIQHSGGELSHVTIHVSSKECTKARDLLSIPAIQTFSKTVCTKPNSSVLTGMGRTGTLKTPLKLSDCIQVIKGHLNQKHVRVAVGALSNLDTEIKVIAACAGSGASLLRGVPANLYITGEMSHHDILDAQQNNINVILCEHSNSERGYLVQLANQLRPKLPGLNVVVSAVDKDPISFM